MNKKYPKGSLQKLITAIGCMACIFFLYLAYYLIFAKQFGNPNNPNSDENAAIMFWTINGLLALSFMLGNSSASWSTPFTLTKYLYSRSPAELKLIAIESNAIAEEIEKENKLDFDRRKIEIESLHGSKLP